MSITVNIDGVDKIVDTPSVNIGGIWRTVSTVCNNIDGIWKQSYPDAYAINLYVYGELYDTLYCTKGSKITLPSVSTVYEDETAHYGWTTTEGSTSRNYAATASITPTADMNLYAVFSYSVTSEGSASISTGSSSSISVASAKTDYAGTAYVSIYRRQSGMSLGTSINNTNSLTLNTDGSVPYVKIGGTYLSLSGIYGYNSQGYAVSVGKGVTISCSSPAYESHSSYTNYWHVGVRYPAYVTTTKYRSTI